MMKRFEIVLYFFGLSCISRGILGTVIRSENFANSIFHEAKCLDTKTGREMFVGEASFRPGKCVRVQCLGTLEIVEYKCNIPQMEPNCIQLPSANLHLNYPDCCPYYECRTVITDEEGGNSGGNRLEIRVFDHYGSFKRGSITESFQIKLHEGEDTNKRAYTKLNL